MWGRNLPDHDGAKSVGDTQNHLTMSMAAKPPEPGQRLATKSGRRNIRRNLIPGVATFARTRHMRSDPARAVAVQHCRTNAACPWPSPANRWRPGDDSENRELGVLSIGSRATIADPAIAMSLQRTAGIIIRQHSVIVLEKLPTGAMSRRPSPKPDPEQQRCICPMGRQRSASPSSGTPLTRIATRVSAFAVAEQPARPRRRRRYATETIRTGFTTRQTERHVYEPLLGRDGL